VIGQEMQSSYFFKTIYYYMGSAEGHEYPNLQVGDEVDPRLFLGKLKIDQPLLLLK
jgi:hypothetical protein